MPAGDDDTNVKLITTLFVSAPSANTAALLQLAPSVAGDGVVYAYVSATPGTVPGVTASITNRTRDRKLGRSSPMEASISDGGFDPVPIAASAGDTLVIVFIAQDRSVLLTGATVVPPLRPPKIVRTNPRPGKKDVPLNTHIEIVFSEPIDPATITPENIKVSAAGAAIAGSLVRTNDFTVEFVPAGLLSAETAHEIVIRSGVRGQSGITLESDVSVDFSTNAASQTSPRPPEAPPEQPNAFACAGGIRCLAFTRQGEIFANASHDSPGSLLLEDASRPAWSADGQMIAFARPANQSLRRWEVCISRADGSDIQCVRSPGEDGIVIGGPSWSPDGTLVAFSTFVYSCPGGQCGQLGGRFSSVNMLDTRTMQITTVGAAQVTSLAWSPDGRTIAYAAFGAGVAGRGALFVMNTDGSNIQQIGQPLGWYSVRGIAWSPDGSKLGLALSDETKCPWYCDTALGVVNADGTGLQILATAQTAFQDPSRAEKYIDFPAWSADGSLLMYTHWGFCYDIDPSCPSEIRAWDFAADASYLLIPNAMYSSWR